MRFRCCQDGFVCAMDDRVVVVTIVARIHHAQLVIGDRVIVSNIVADQENLVPEIFMLRPTPNI